MDKDKIRSDDSKCLRTPNDRCNNYLLNKNRPISSRSNMRWKQVERIERSNVASALWLGYMVGVEVVNGAHSAETNLI